jgi:hypothetical protein
MRRECAAGACLSASPLGNRAGSLGCAYRVGLHLPNVWCVPIRAGSAPRAPRWGTVPVPQTPPQVA